MKRVGSVETMFALERQQEIVKNARENGRVNVSELAANFDVSTETVRRDLTLLEHQSLLRRVHGGAVPIELYAAAPDLDHRHDMMAGAKHAIGRRATEEIPKSGSILIDAGTTTACLAESISGNQPLTIVTNALPIAQLLVKHPNLTVHALGGRVQRKSLATVDHWALEQLATLDIDVLFLGAFGVSLTRGISTPDSFEAIVKRAMIRCAKRVVVLADSSKLNRSFLSVIAPVEAVDLLITDSGAAEEHVDALSAIGLDVIIA